MSVCDLPVLNTVCDTAGASVATAVVAPFRWLADAMVSAAAWTIDIMWAGFESTTFVDVTSDRFTSIYGIVFGIAVFVMLGMFLLQLIGAMIRREPAALSRAVAGLGKAVLGSFVALSLIAAALEIVDRLCLGIMAAAGTTLEEMGGRISALTAGLTLSGAGGPAMPILAVIALAALVIAAAFTVWISLLARKALLLVAVVLAPVAFAGATWDSARGWVGRWGAFVLALVVSKLVVVVIFLLATAQVAAPISADLQSFADPLAGVVLMMVAGFAPYLTYKFISFMGVDTHHATSAEQETKHALDRPMPAPHRVPPHRSPASVLDVVPPKSSNGLPSPGSTPTRTTAFGTRGTASGVPAAGSGEASAAGASSPVARGAAGSGASGATPGAGAAAGGVGAGAAVVAGAAKAGPAAGRAVANQASQHDQSAREVQP